VSDADVQFQPLLVCIIASHLLVFLSVDFLYLCDDYWFYVSFAGLGLGLSLGTASLGLGLKELVLIFVLVLIRLAVVFTAGHDYNTAEI